MEHQYRSSEPQNNQPYSVQDFSAKPKQKHNTPSPFNISKYNRLQIALHLI